MPPSVIRGIKLRSSAPTPICITRSLPPGSDRGGWKEVHLHSSQTVVKPDIRPRSPASQAAHPSPARRPSPQTMLAFTTNICYNPPFPPPPALGPMPASCTSCTTIKKAEFQGVPAKTDKISSVRIRHAQISPGTTAQGANLLSAQVRVRLLPGLSDPVAGGQARSASDAPTRYLIAPAKQSPADFITPARPPSATPQHPARSSRALKCPPSKPCINLASRERSPPALRPNLASRCIKPTTPQRSAPKTPRSPPQPPHLQLHKTPQS